MKDSLIHIQIANTSCIALVDTGSNLCLISKARLEQISPRSVYNISYFQTPHTAILANGAEISLPAQVYLDFYIQGRKFRNVRFYLISQAVYPVIIGSNFLRDNQVTLSFKPISKLTNPIQVIPVRAPYSIVLTPRETKTIRIRLKIPIDWIAAQLRHIPKNTGMNGIYIQHACFTTNNSNYVKETTITVNMTNCTSKQIIIPKHTSVVVLSSLRSLESIQKAIAAVQRKPYYKKRQITTAPFYPSMRQSHQQSLESNPLAARNDPFKSNRHSTRKPPVIQSDSRKSINENPDTQQFLGQFKIDRNYKKFF